MSFQEKPAPHPDLGSIETFIRELPYVETASVWVSNGRLLAHVTIHEFTPVVPNTIRAACLHELGAHLTPEEVYLIVDRELVA
jgi:hypothetical protein